MYACLYVYVNAALGRLALTGTSDCSSSTLSTTSQANQHLPPATIGRAGPHRAGLAPGRPGSVATDACLVVANAMLRWAPHHTSGFGPVLCAPTDTNVCTAHGTEGVSNGHGRERHSATAAMALYAPLIADKGTGSVANLSDVYMAGLNLTPSSFADVSATWPSFLEPPLTFDGLVAEGVTPRPTSSTL